MGSIGGWELVLILMLALLLFGPRRLPEIGKTIGKALAELRRTTTDLKMNLEREVDLEQVKDLRGSIRSAKQEVSDTVNQLRQLGVSTPARPEPRAETERAPEGSGTENGANRADPNPDDGTRRPT